MNLSQMEQLGLKGLRNVLQSPLDLTLEGENGEVLATMPLENAPGAFCAKNMPFMGFPPQNASFGSPHRGGPTLM